MDDIWYLIYVIIGAIVLITLVFSLYSQERTKESAFEKWEDCSWEDVSDTRYKLALWKIIILLIIAFFPIVNYFSIIVFFSWYFYQLSGTKDFYTCNLTDHRFVVKNKVFSFICSFLAKEM